MVPSYRSEVTASMAPRMSPANIPPATEASLTRNLGLTGELSHRETCTLSKPLIRTCSNRAR